MSEHHYDLKSGSVGGMVPSTRTRKRRRKDPYHYGWRTLWDRGPDGREESRVVPLTYQDLLDPQLGDKMTQDSLHIQLVALLMSLLRTHFSSEPKVAVFGDLKVIFDIPGLPGPGPDVFVVRGARDRDRRRKSFRVAEEPGDIVLVIEVVSPEYREKDYESLPRIYEKAGISEYVIIEALEKNLTDPYKLTGHRLGEDRRYHAIELDEQGGLELESVGLRITPDAGGWGLALVDRATGQRLLTQEEDRSAREHAELRAEEEARRAEKEAQARLAAEKQAAAEAQARQALEEKIARLENELRDMRRSD